MERNTHSVEMIRLLALGGVVLVVSALFLVSVFSNSGAVIAQQVSVHRGVAAQGKAVCGNSLVEFNEACDGGSRFCLASGYSGSQSCNSSCTGWGACTSTDFCGDGLINGPEVCDGSNLNGSTCSSVNGSYVGGTLGCMSSCATFDESQCELAWPGMATTQDVSYGSDPDQVFDWYAPRYTVAHADARPVIVFFHGGGFDQGATEIIDETQEPFSEFLARGYAVASVRYLQRPAAPYPTMFTEMGRAIQYLRANAPMFNIDSQKIVAYGVSSGAAGAAYLSFAPDLASPSSSDPVLHESSRPNAFVNDRAMTDWRALVGTIAIQFHPFTAPTLGNVPAQDIAEASALYWLEQSNPPAIPVISFYIAPAHVPPLVNVHDGYFGETLTNTLTTLGETHSSIHYYSTGALPWNDVYDWLADLYGA